MDLERRVLAVLEWAEPRPLLQSVIEAVQAQPLQLTFTKYAAVSLDANVLINLGKGAQGVEVIDYLGSQHQGPIVVSSQVLIEFWNNQLNGVDGFFGAFKKQSEDLTKTVQELDPRYSELQEAAVRVVAEFESKFGHVLSARTRDDVNSLFEMLATRAVVSQVERPLFLAAAEARRAAKVPPGFRDEGLGDFFVWAEMLKGLLSLGEPITFDQVVLVTEDTKKDWSIKGVPHPSLSAEVAALFGVPFRVATLKEFKADVSRILQEP